MKKSLWFVAVSYTGECCLKAHIKAEIVLASTRSDAKRAVVRKLKRREWETGGAVAIAVPEGVRKADFDFLKEGS